MTRKPRPRGRDFGGGARIAAVMLAAVAAAAVLASQDAADPAPQVEVLRHVSTALGR
ncbi:MAG TPA: hypothetical protein VFQ20_07220 [Burkholderiaceae bacterium]|nr:hypothetical protein [Burkholderiaceae bacterium]